MFVQSTKQWHNWRFELEGKLSEKRPNGLRRGPTSQQSEKKLRNGGESWCGWLQGQIIIIQQGV